MPDVDNVEPSSSSSSPSTFSTQEAEQTVLKEATQPAISSISTEPTKPQQRSTLSWLFFGFINLFFQRKFIIHRVLGLAYLLQYTYAVLLFFYDYDRFKHSWVIIALPLTGVIQSISAILTFTFLPKKTLNPGYYSDKSSLSYPFVKENLFFAIILAFQWLYYNEALYPYWKKFYLAEYLFVFLPYVFRNPLFPKTHFRDGIKSIRKDANYNFYFYLTHMTKIFYIWAKHYIGFFLNYLRFFDLATDYDVKCVFLVLLAGSFATTISMFLHTLRFKRYTSGRTSFTIYVISYLSTFIGYAMIFHVFLREAALFFVTLTGLVLNLVNLRVFDAYQFGLMLCCHFGYLSY